MSSYLDHIFKLKGKVVVITGATGQLGQVFCNAYKEAGATVVGLDVKIDNTEKNGITYMALDITSKSQVLQVMESIFSKYRRIDVLFNNAGVSTFEPFEERLEEKLDWVMDVNLKGTFFCIQSYVNLFDQYKQDEGCILNIASFYGVISPDFRIYTDCDRKNSEIYGVTKAGVIQMTKYFAVHLAERKIRVNSISPGGIFNPENPQGKDFVQNYSFRCPMKRMANADEMIGAALYLTGNGATYTTGQNIVVDGGMSCW